VSGPQQRKRRPSSVAADPKAELPPKVDGEHRWVVTIGHTLPVTRAAAFASGARVTLDNDSMFEIHIGCYDCEQTYADALTRCPGDFDTRADLDHAVVVNPLDGDVPDAARLTAMAADEPLLVAHDVQTSAAEAMSKDGTHAKVILLRFEGHMNGTRDRAVHQIMVLPDGADHLVDALTQSISFNATGGGSTLPGNFDPRATWTTGDAWPDDASPKLVAERDARDKVLGAIAEKAGFDLTDLATAGAMRTAIMAVQAVHIVTGRTRPNDPGFPAEVVDTLGWVTYLLDRRITAAAPDGEGAYCPACRRVLTAGETCEHDPRPGAGDG
jgi:hypothetical protein